MQTLSCRKSGQTRRKTYGPGAIRTHDHAFCLKFLQCLATHIVHIGQVSKAKFPHGRAGSEF